MQWGQRRSWARTSFAVISILRKNWNRMRLTTIVHQYWPRTCEKCPVDRQGAHEVFFFIVCSCFKRVTWSKLNSWRKKSKHTLNHTTCIEVLTIWVRQRAARTKEYASRGRSVQNARRFERARDHFRKNTRPNQRGNLKSLLSAVSTRVLQCSVTIWT